MNFSKLLICSLILIPIACKMEKSQLTLITKTELLNFPSASSIEFHNGLLYVIGDDARHLAIIDNNYKLIDTVSLFPGDGLRIPKKIKTDLEASTIVKFNNRDTLLVAGSSSTPEREYLLLFPLEHMSSNERVSTKAFVDKLLELGLKQVNFEGLAAMNDMLVFGNRGNNDIQHNHFVIAPAANVSSLQNSTPLLVELDLGNDGGFKGLSGLAYIESLDMLLFTASVEQTSNAYDDGDIGDSFLGYIRKFSSKIHEKIIQPDELLNLPATLSAFQNEKIESVAVESVGRNIILHLVADNDNGISTLFKLSFPNPAK